MKSNKLKGESDLGHVVRNFLMASVSGMVGEAVTIPLDTAKVRLQVQKVELGVEPRYKGLIGTIGRISAEEGAGALYNGLSAGLQRQFVFAGLRVGLYLPIRNLITGPLEPGQFPTMGQKIITSFATGTIGISVANPTDLVKIKLQGQGADILKGIPPKYNGCFDCYRQLLKEGGIPNLWTGWGPNVLRNSVINAAELATYDQFKEMLLKYNIVKDGTPCHLASASLAGFAAVCVGSPLDVVKTRVMNAAPGVYKNPIDCVIKVAKNEGPMAFYKGFIPNVARISGWCCVMFLTFENIKNYFEGTPS